MFDMKTAIANMGFNNIRYKNPLRAGGTIRAETEIIELKETSGPDRRLVIHKETCMNQRGEVLIEREQTHLIMRRPQ